MRVVSSLGVGYSIVYLLLRGGGGGGGGEAHIYAYTIHNHNVLRGIIHNLQGLSEKINISLSF